MRSVRRSAWACLIGVSGITLAIAGGVHSAALERWSVVGLLGSHFLTWLPVLVRRAPRLRAAFIALGILLAPIGGPVALLLVGLREAAGGYLLGSSLGMCLAWTSGPHPWSQSGDGPRSSRQDGPSPID